MQQLECGRHRHGRMQAWLDSIPAMAASCSGTLAVFTLSDEWAERVKALAIPNVVVNPKPPKRDTFVMYDEAKEIDESLFDSITSRIRSGSLVKGVE